MQGSGWRGSCVERVGFRGWYLAATLLAAAGVAELEGAPEPALLMQRARLGHLVYLGASLMRNRHPHRTTTRPQAQAYGKVLGGVRFLKHPTP